MGGVWAAILVVGAGAEPGAVDYGRDVRPIFEARCYACHGPAKAKAGLRLDGLPHLLRGGDGGPAVVPGVASESLILRAIGGDDPDVQPMPPRGSRLTRDEVAVIRAWVEQGAHAPDGLPAAGAGSAQAGDGHWAFRPVVRPVPPPVRGGAWVRSPIDRFILERLERSGVAPSPEADRVTLIRRLSFDLTGLPPTAEEAEAFAADPRPDAYERVVERLLASPHYGERWGRHWLDAVGYADSGGYESDTPRSLWAYRDWVIDALNRNLSFDRFAVAQLAGDLLSRAGRGETVATGLLCTAMYDGTLGQGEAARLKMTVDRVNTVGTVFLGMTLGCAQCHSHKFDPVSQREYYEFLAFFDSLADGPGEAGVALDLLPPAEAARRDAVRAQAAALATELAAYEQTARAGSSAWEARLRPADVARLAPDVRAALAIAPARRSGPQAGAVLAAFFEQDEGHRERRGTIQAVRGREPAAVTTQVARERPEPRVTHVLRRGELSQPGEAVTPGVPACLPPLPRGGGPGRLDLARWVASATNPLTARVAVNRVWQHVFGLGLVETEDNFGLSGEPPSHPELLDWLAAEFVDRGWDVKALQRSIVTSAAYRQASRARPDLDGLDPRNRLVARQARLRLEAESVRDAALAVGGLLARKIGGPSVFPDQPAGVLDARATKADWVVSPGADRYRRGLYTYFWRLTPHPFLRLFDAPDATAACTRRGRSNTPLQALTLLNDPTLVGCARALAARLQSEVPSAGPERVRRAFRVCLGRDPSPAEIGRVARYLSEARVAGDGDEWVGLARALLNLDEFITRE